MHWEQVFLLVLAGFKTAGPGAILVAYGAIGFVVYMVMTALGEIASFIPLPGFANYGRIR